MSSNAPSAAMQSSGRSSSPVSPDARLAASRLAMRTAMLPVASGVPREKPSGLRSRLGALPHAVEGLMSHPVVSLLKDTVRTWWARHPWRPFVAVGGIAAKEMMVPLARQHPGRLIGGAMLAGAVLSRWRPWKLLLVGVGPAVVASMLPTLISSLATRLPIAALLKAASMGSSVPERTVDAAVPMGAMPAGENPVVVVKVDAKQ